MPKFAFKVISVTKSGSHAFAEAFLATKALNLPLGLTGLLPLAKGEPTPAAQSFIDMDLPDNFKVGVMYREIVVDDEIVADSGRNYFVVEQK